MSNTLNALLNATKREYNNASMGLFEDTDAELLCDLYHASVASNSDDIIDARKNICSYLNEYETINSADELKSHAHFLKDAMDALEK
jgi:hypothetical protein